MESALTTVETSTTMDHDDLTPMDYDILRYLATGRGGNRPWGRSTPSKIAEEIGSRKQYIHTRLQVLKAGGLVTMHTSGVYEISPDGQDYVDGAATIEAWEDKVESQSDS